MKYDFITAPNRRNSGSSKWEGMKGLNPNVPESVVPLSVADMELKNPPEIMEGLKEYLDQAVLGYPCGTDSFYEAVESWTRRRYGWETKREWLITTPGIVNAFHQAVLAYTEPGDGVILLTPVYYPFSFAVRRNDRKEVRCPLVNINGRYEIDYELLEEMAGKPENKLIIFCSPHNPVGRVWTRDELERVGRICIDNHVFIVSDEIHCELVMPGNKFTPFAAVNEDCKNNGVTLNSPTKNFNIAGLQIANIVCANPVWRRRIGRAINIFEVCDVNPFGPVALEAAYNDSENWMDELNEYLFANYQLLCDTFAKELPQYEVMRLEGTYLVWVDVRPSGLSSDEVAEKLLKEGKVQVNSGTMYGQTTGEGYVRINIACPRATLIEGLKRMVDVLK